MAVLGVGGRLELRRELPDPIVFSFSTYNSDTLTVTPTYGCNWQHWWTGDSAMLVYFDATNAALGTSSVFICVDELNRISFYADKCTSMACQLDRRLDINDFSFAGDIDSIGVYPAGNVPYTNARANCIPAGAGDYAYFDVVDDDDITDSMCDHPPDYLLPIAGTTPYENADIQPRSEIDSSESLGQWLCVADIREWSLELDAPAVDTTSVGDKFGEAVKSLVNGGGEVNFLVDRACHPHLEEPEVLMQLLLMTKSGAKASARFYLVDSSRSDCENIAGTLYYEADLLITRNAINLRPTEVVACTATFVTTGEIKLLMHGA